MSKNLVSLICTVKNDAEALENLFQNIEQQNVQPDEIVVSVADSVDTTLEIAKTWQKTLSGLKVLEVGQANRAVGRNKAVQASSGSILIFTDAGCRLATQWIEEILQPFQDPEVTLVSGLTLGDPHNTWEAAQVPFVLVSPEDQPEHPLPATRNMALRRSTWEKIGPFQSKLSTAEDFEWSRRAYQKGIRAVLATKAVVHWRPRGNSLAFWNMIFNLTRGDVQARTWRKGHFTMLGRYVVLLLLFTILPYIAIFIWLLYLFVKSRITSSRARTSFLQTLKMQILADTAVCLGILAGIWDNLLGKKEEL